MKSGIARVQPLVVRTEKSLGRYQLVAPLGQGGMGTIYLAVAGGLADFRKLLVVKELRQDLSANQRFVEMFLDEAKLAARLNHPNVVQTIEASQEDGRYFLVMEFLEGQPYSAVFQSALTSPLVTLPIRLKILCEALAGLQYAHTLSEYDGTSLHIVHRDVSPQNIFVTYDGQVKVVDFGIAKAAVSNASNTSPGMFKGKFGYAAPEQVRGHEDLDARTDIFAMGVILWEALAMRRFSDGHVNRMSVANRLAGQEQRASKLPGVDRRLAAICDRALAVDPDQRFGSAEEFRIALEDFLVQSDQRVEISSIKQVMAKTFAAERQAMNQLIDSHIKGDAVEESRVHVTALNSEDGNNQPTQLADLSNYIHNTHNETVVTSIAVSVAPRPTVPAPSNRKLNAKVLIGGGVAVLAIAALSTGFLALSGAKKDPPVGSLARTGPGAQVQAPASAQPEVVQPAAAEPASPAVAPPTAAPVQQPAAAAATAQDDSDPVLPGRAHPAAVRRTQRPRTAAAPEPRVVQAAAPQVEAPPAPAPVAPARVEPASGAAPKLSIGSDLNRMEKSHQRRAIDTEL